MQLSAIEYVCLRALAVEYLTHFLPEIINFSYLV